MQKRLVRSPTAFLRRDQDVLRLSAASASGLVVRSSVPSSGAPFSGMVDIDAMLSFARGSGDVDMSPRDGRLFMKGKGVKGDIPLLSEQPPRIPKIEDSNAIHAADVRWLATNLPRVVVPDLNKSGTLSAVCDGASWSLSCNDDVHGACVYGRGRSKIAFALMPADADALQALLRDAKEVQMGFSENLLVLRTEDHQAAIPVVDGAPHSKESVVGGTKSVASIDCASMRAALSAVNAVASAKEAAPLTLVVGGERSITLRASSPAGGIESLVRATCKRELEFRVSHQLIVALMARADTEQGSLLVTIENQEVTRIALECDDLYLVMLTST